MKRLLAIAGALLVLASLCYSAPGDKISYVTTGRLGNYSSATQAKLGLKLDTNTFASYTSIDRLTAATAAATYAPYSSATRNVKLGSKTLNAAAVNLTGTGGTGYITLPAQSSNPTSPAAGTLLIHSSTANGFTRMEQDNEAATNLIYGRDNVFIAKNTSGSTIAAGSAVYKTGSTGNVPNIGLAKADSTTTLPAIGIALDAIDNNNFGQVMSWGIKSGFDTSALGTSSVWVSPTTAGVLTSTRPTYPNFTQRIGSVLVNGVGNGSLLVTTAPHIGGMDTGTNASTFTATTFVGALTGNASTATTLATGRTIAMTGDVSWTSPSFNGSGNVTAAGTLTNGLSSYQWDAWNPSDVAGTATNAPGTGTADASSYTTLSNSSGTLTVTFGTAGKYLVTVNAFQTHGNVYTVTRVTYTIGGTATSRIAYSPNFIGDSAADEDSTGSVSFYVSATASQTLTLLPKFQVVGSGTTANHTARAHATILYAGQ